MPPVRMSRVFIWSSVASSVVAPLLFVLAQAMFSQAHVAEVFAGAFVATAFFAVTNVTVLLFEKRVELKSALVTSYVIKTGILVAAFYGLGSIEMDRPSFGFSIALSGVVYVATQGILGSRRTVI